MTPHALPRPGPITMEQKERLVGIAVAELATHSEMSEAGLGRRELHMIAVSVLRAVTPEHEKQVREQVAAKLEAYVDGRAALGWAKNLQAVARQIAADIRRGGCPLCGGTGVVPGSEDYDSAVHMYNPSTGEPCDCVLRGES